MIDLWLHVFQAQNRSETCFKKKIKKPGNGAAQKMSAAVTQTSGKLAFMRGPVSWICQWLQVFFFYVCVCVCTVCFRKIIYILRGSALMQTSQTGNIFPDCHAGSWRFAIFQTLFRVSSCMCCWWKPWSESGDSIGLHLLICWVCIVNAALLFPGSSPEPLPGEGGHAQKTSPSASQPDAQRILSGSSHTHLNCASRFRL